MGFKVPRRKLQIGFGEGHEYYGASAELTLDLPLGMVFQLQALREEDQAQEAIRMFADNVLDSWNLEDDDGNPVPPTFEGAQAVPVSFVTALMDRWASEATTAPAPLETASSDITLLAVPSTETGT